MTEVASLNMPPDHRLTAVRRYDAGPPSGLELVEPGETYATTKEEEWVSKKKTEVTNTKQIETRVKRQVVLEDGKVVEDSGPLVTTNTTEDTETQEHHQTELRKLGDDDVDGPQAIENAEKGTTDKSKWIAVPNPEGVVREVKERKVISREETEEVKETEDVQHLGDITDEDFLAAVHSGESDIRKVLKTTEAGRTVVSTGPRLVHDSTKSKKVTDTEDTRELSSVQPDGKIITETQRTTKHEEVKDDELPEDAPEQDCQKENFERYAKTREQEEVDYFADGVKIGHEMRFKTETMDVERRGDGVDEPDLFDSLSARARRRANNRQPQRYRGVENGVTTASPLDRKDALTRKPLDFDQEEETRKAETSKWLENHFGSDSRSSNNSLIDDEEQPPKTNFFKVTIKSQPAVTEHVQNSSYVSTVNNSSSRVYSPVESERDRNRSGGYYKGISEWSERRQERRYSSDCLSPSPPNHRIPYPPDHHRRQSPVPDYRTSSSPVPDYRTSHSPPQVYRNQSPSPDYLRTRPSPLREVISVTPTPPQRKKDRGQRIVTDRVRQENGYRSAKIVDREIEKKVEEPPPDYSPPSPTPVHNDRKSIQKTRFAPEPVTKAPKSGNIIGQSIRKLVGKIRSASAERKAAKQRAKRSPSPTYQQGHIIDNNICVPTMDRPVQRYYLGEDPFAGSIYGRENKYDGVKPARISRKPREIQEERRSQSTLGRFSKSANRLANNSGEERISSQTLPRHLSRQEPPTRLENRSNSTINVSIINTVSSPRKLEGPAKPARTYRSNLSRSKSLNVHGALDSNRTNMYTSNPQLNRLADKPIGLKSPGLISSINNRSSRDVSEEVYNTRFNRNGVSDNVDNKRVFLSSLKDRAPELFQTLEETDRDWSPNKYSTPIKNGKVHNGDIYEAPTREPKRLVSNPNNSVLRRGSSSSTDFSETYHTTTRNDDPKRPSVTNTTKSFSRKTLPLKDGKGVETIESSETTSVTKSSYRSNEPSKKYYEERRHNRSGANPVVIEVRNYRK